jgi:hypothetical protein
MKKVRRALPRANTAPRWRYVAPLSGRCALLAPLAHHLHLTRLVLFTKRSEVAITTGGSIIPTVAINSANAVLEGRNLLGPIGMERLPTFLPGINVTKRRGSSLH